MLTYNDIKKNDKINTYIAKADASLEALGYTEHSYIHACRVAENAAYILEELGYSAREAELARIAAYMHDIGNLVNRVEHSQSGAIIAFKILDELNMDVNEIADIVSAIGNHDEGTGVAVNSIAAALIIADKCDVRRSRVRNVSEIGHDIHDRVNYSVTSSMISVDKETMSLTLNMTIDTEYSSVMEYFEIFLDRMLMCRHAAEKLALTFKLFINEQMII